MPRTVAIVGGGFSGAMLAARLAEDGVDVRLINRTAAFGLGVAYSTDCDAHLLNVRAGRMSARADDPDHFVRWLSRHYPHLASPETFAPRRIYGLYVQATLAEAEARFPGRIRRIVGEAVSVDDTTVVLDDGARIQADAIVLATGNPPPRTADDSAGQTITDPWAPGELDRIGPTDDIVIVGTGLTMIDVILALDARGWTGRAAAISRRGLVPRSHDQHQPHVASSAAPEGPLSRRLAEARARARAEGWAEFMDGLRHGNAETWAGLDTPSRARFLRHLRPWWDVHRHRVAPVPAARIAELEANGRLQLLAGRIGRFDAAARQLTYRPRGQSEDITVACDRLIDCTGPGHNPTRATAPLIRDLIGQGLARPDPLTLGLDVSPDARLIDAQGAPSSRLFVLGPPALAAYWETVAVPDIRQRIDSLARILAETLD
jgi:uncharacterized NAD(P)/FAD-binding protein YdhS